MKTYRVIETFTNEFTAEEDRVTEKVIWQGDDVDALSRLHPPSEVFGVDSLSHHELEEGYLRWWYRFETLQEDGTWVKCKDPRHPVDDPIFRAIEQESDEYNRKMYPGDYMEYDNDCYGPFDDEW